MKTTTRNACILFAIAGIALTIGLGFMLSKDNKEPEAAPLQNVFADLPEAEQTVMPDSKSDAYMRHQEEKSKIEDYWDHCSPDKETPEQTQTSPSAAVSAPKAASAEDLLGLNEPAKRSPAPRTTPSNPYRETAEEREARHQRRHEEAIELAERIQENQRVTAHTSPVQEETAPITESDPLPATKVKRSDVISSLDGWEGDNSLSSLDSDSSEEPDDAYTPFRCMFARESKITDGQRVTVILLDDINISGISVPRNTHLMATCQLTNRLELEFANIEIGGRILSLGFEAYDVDGSKGIYCPDAGTAGKTVKNRGTDIISSTLSSRLGRVARDVASTGISLIQSADGQRTVSIPAGYTFFIIKKKQN